VHMQQHGQPGKPGLEIQGQQGPVVDVHQSRGYPADKSGRPPVVQGQQMPVAAVEPLLAKVQKNSPKFDLPPGFLKGQIRVGGADDYRAIAAQMSCQPVDKQFCGPAPDRRNGKKLRPDQRDGGHLKESSG
jgi:hypothetical protein